MLSWHRQQCTGRRAGGQQLVACSMSCVGRHARARACRPATAGLAPKKTQAGRRHGKKAISGHMLWHENFRLSANVLQLPEGDY